MPAAVDTHWVTSLDEAVEHLRRLADDRPLDDPTRPRIEAARDRLASYALAVRNVAAAGVSPERLTDLVERGWRDAALALSGASRSESSRRQPDTGF